MSKRNRARITTLGGAIGTASTLLYIRNGPEADEHGAVFLMYLLFMSLLTTIVGAFFWGRSPSH